MCEGLFSFVHTVRRILWFVDDRCNNLYHKVGIINMLIRSITFFPISTLKSVCVCVLDHVVPIFDFLPGKYANCCDALVTKHSIALCFSFSYLHVKNLRTTAGESVNTGYFKAAHVNAFSSVNISAFSFCFVYCLSLLLWNQRPFLNNPSWS